MVFVPRPARPPTFTSAQVTGFYFQPCRDDNDEVILEYFRCRCGTVRKQTRRNGLTNLMQHVRREHPNFEAEMLEATTAETGTSHTLYGWLLWTIMSNLPSRSARIAQRDGVVLAVERSIASEMPDIFGLILDGWTHLSEHYLAVFACYEVNGKVKTPLLCMAPLLNEPDDDLSAVAHMEFLANMLPRDFGKQLQQCVFIVGDNCSVNRRLATLVNVPLVGCASHRLNLAVQQQLEDHEDDLAEVQALMIKLRTLTQSAMLRLGPRADIIHSPDFESGCVRVLRGKTARLTRAEKAALRPFANGAPPGPPADGEDEGSFVERPEKRRKLAVEEQQYALLRSIPPTSNMVERFFSLAGVTFGHERNSLHPVTLEQILFLRQNSSYWDVRTVDSVRL
ncbi:Ribonuclease H-like domain [Phytophthora cactorum]|nr:Ribonuclease H-like domain [Phytophthora cactorum]